ncbi:hypothetical protein QQ045_003258 [Rhodiola kirilowii]
MILFVDLFHIMQNRAFFRFFRTVGEEHAKAIEEARDALAVLEKEGLGENKYFGGNEVGMIDLEYGFVACWLILVEEALNIKIISRSNEEFPRLKALCEEFKNIKVVKETVIDREKRLQAS